MKKYLFEFLTMFVSLTAAFYVDNFRQTLEDKENYHKYLLGLLDDLKSDSSAFSWASGNLSKSLKYSDSLNQIMAKPTVEVNRFVLALANSSMNNFDLGIQNSTNYTSLINSGNLKLIEDTEYRKTLKDYYRVTEFYLKNYDNEFQVFRTTELYPYLNSKIPMERIKWKDGWATLTGDVKFDISIVGQTEFKNYIVRTRQFIYDFKQAIDENILRNNYLLSITRKKLSSPEIGLHKL